MINQIQASAFRKKKKETLRRTKDNAPESSISGWSLQGEYGASSQQQLCPRVRFYRYGPVIPTFGGHLLSLMYNDRKGLIKSSTTLIEIITA